MTLFVQEMRTIFFESFTFDMLIKIKAMRKLFGFVAPINDKIADAQLLFKLSRMEIDGTLLTSSNPLLSSVYCIFPAIFVIEKAN